MRPDSKDKPIEVPPIDQQIDEKDVLINLSHEDFVNLGLQDFAYIQSPKQKGQGFIARAADGQFLGEWHSQELAEAILIQSGLDIAYLN